MDERVLVHAEGTLDEGEGDEGEEHCVGVVGGGGRIGCSMIGGLRSMVDFVMDWKCWWK